MSLKKLAIDHIPHLIKDKKVLMRVDFNVPMKDGVITDPKRIVSTLPSINYLLDNGAASVILMSHRGRPKGSKQSQFSLEPLVPAVSDLLKTNVQWVPDCVGADAAKACGESKNGQVLLLENLRFYLAEEGKGEVNGEKVKPPPEKLLISEANLLLTVISTLTMLSVLPTELTPPWSALMSRPEPLDYSSRRNSTISPKFWKDQRGHSPLLWEVPRLRIRFN